MLLLVKRFKFNITSQLISICNESLSSVIKGHERCFSLNSSHSTFQRYVKREPAYITAIKKRQLEEQKEVDKFKALSKLERTQEEVPTSDVKVPIRPTRTATAQTELEENFSPFRFVYPEFLPDPKLEWRNRVREKLERIDMLRRRSNLEIPEFYVGSIMKVIFSDRYGTGKTNEFLGICIERGGCGLRAFFTLRNVIDGQGVEIRFEMYNPIVQSIQVLRLEKRVDECLRYLRDCPLEYSTFPMDMQSELRHPDALVPINTTTVRIKPKPWTVKWHLYQYKGIENLYDQISENWEYRKWSAARVTLGTDSNEFDLMKTYRETITSDEQTGIFSEISPQLAKLTQTLKKQKKKRTFAKPQKIA